jgi:hypothetical protein
MDLINAMAHRLHNGLIFLCADREDWPGRIAGKIQWTEVKKEFVREIEAGIFNVSTVLIGCIALKVLTNSFRLGPFEVIFLTVSVVGRWVSEEALFLGVESAVEKTAAAVVSFFSPRMALELPGYRPIKVKEYTLFWISPTLRGQ